MRLRLIAFLVLLASALAARPFAPAAYADQDFNFAITRSFIQGLAEENSLATTIKVRTHGLASDCEMPFAGMPTPNLGAPRAVIVEPLLKS